MKYFLLFSSLLSISASAADMICEYPELRGPDQKIEVSLNYQKKTATVKVNGRIIADCKDASFTTRGEVYEYGEGVMMINCKGGKKVIYENNYDERFIDVGQLKLNLGDNRYSC